MKAPSNMARCLPWHLLWLAEHMRSDECEQFRVFSFSDQYDAEQAASYFIGLSGPRFAVLQPDGLPAAAGGYYSVAPGVWRSWMAGTAEGWALHWRSITKATRWLMESLMTQGARRLETTALADRTKAREWYERSLSLKFEGIARRYGSSGEDMVTYAKTRED